MPSLAAAQATEGTESSGAGEVDPDAVIPDAVIPDAVDPDAVVPDETTRDEGGTSGTLEAGAVSDETAEAEAADPAHSPTDDDAATHQTPGESASAAALSAPTPPESRPPLDLSMDDERAPAYGSGSIEAPPPPAPVETRPRDWRYSRRRAQRPLTLPQGALRLRNTKAVGYIGTAAVTASFSVAAGLHDDFEIGGTPLGLGLSGIFPYPHDPEAYARLRVLSGPVQLAFRSNVVFPLLADDLQWGLTAELAWIAEDWVRVDTGLDYQMLFDQPFQQRVGVPLAVTLQGGINAVTLTSAVYVFNDFDDVDVPVLLRYSVAFGGHQGPVAEVGMEGGFLDVIPDPEVAWTVRANVTWFAYFGRP